jgi:hypothetical protein
MRRGVAGHSSRRIAMKLRTTALAAALAIATSNVAFAEGETPIPGHPAEGSTAAATAASVDPFSLAVPQLERDEPVPSYGLPRAAGTNEPPANADASMEGMDHSAMPGMKHDTN